MKRFAIALAALVVALSATPVRAANVDLGLINKSDNSFQIFKYDNKGMYQNEIIGFLPKNTMVTFTYTLTPASAGVDAILSAYGTYAPTYNLSSTAGVGKVIPPKASDDNLLSVLAALPTVDSGKTVFSNFSDALVSIRTGITYLLSAGASLRVDVNVSSVPLPAALPLFGLGIASLAGYRMRKKKAA